MPPTRTGSPTISNCLGCWISLGLGQAYQRVQCFLPALLRGHVQCRVAAIVGKRQHLGKKCGVFARGGGSHEQGIKLVEPSRSGVVSRQAGSALQLADDRIERAVGMLRRAEITQTRMWIA